MTAAKSAERSDLGIPVGINLGLTAAFLGIGLALVLLLPLALADHPAWGLLLIPFTLATPTLWALIHESIHAGLHPERRRNDALGRALCVLFGSPLRILRFGHLTHHLVYSAQREVLPAKCPVPRVFCVLLYYPRIFAGVYVAEVMASLLAWLPRAVLLRLSRQALRAYSAAGLDLRSQVERRLLTPKALAELRLDGLLVLALYGCGFYLYGADAWMLVAALVGRAAIVSFLDNLYHHVPAGGKPATFNLSLPGWASRAILHANLHAVHHRRPGIPWTALPRALEPSRDGPSHGFVRASLDQILRPAV